MLWYNHLYVGEKAKKHRFTIIQKLRKNQIQPGIYVITPASNPNNIMDIYSTMMLFEAPIETKEWMVIGIADGYQEALELCREIVDAMYQKTGAFCLREFLEEK